MVTMDQWVADRSVYVAMTLSDLARRDTILIFFLAISAIMLISFDLNDQIWYSSDVFLEVSYAPSQRNGAIVSPKFWHPYIRPYV